MFDGSSVFLLCLQWSDINLARYPFPVCRDRCVPYQNAYTYRWYISQKNWQKIAVYGNQGVYSTKLFSYNWQGEGHNISLKSLETSLDRIRAKATEFISGK